MAEDFDQEARGAFEGIAACDPERAMAHWGVAMTLFQPLWSARSRRPADWVSLHPIREGVEIPHPKRDLYFEGLAGARASGSGTQRG